MSTNADRHVIFTAGTTCAALPVQRLAEVMRPLPIQSLDGAPSFVLGLAIIRGVPTPVVSVQRLLDQGGTDRPGRFITVHADSRVVALAVTAIIGMRDLTAADLAPVPPLLDQARPDLVAALGTHDRGLLFVLRAAHVIPADLWAQVAAATAAAPTTGTGP